eukprot:c23849_g1_i1 orf=317-1294(+)
MAVAAAAVSQTQTAVEINWDRLDKTKFYVMGAGIFSAVSTLLYPISVVKTRMQIATKDCVHMTGPTLAKNILREDGIRGLYRGFFTVIVGAIPSRIVFLTALETTKVSVFKSTENLNMSEATRAAVANGTAGLTSSVISQAVFVPLDVVSQRLMVQGTVGATKYSGGFDAVKKIIKIDGISGLYRGFGMSVLTYSPSSAVWWAAYGSSQRIIWRALGYSIPEKDAGIPSLWEIGAVQATGGVVAGAVSSIATTPLDTIKTRLQVMEEVGGGRPTVSSTIRRLLTEDGLKGFYRGLGPRFLSMSAWGTCMIVSYEFLKRLSVKHED